MTKPRVVMLAPSCDPDDVGEALSTFRWASHLSELCDLTVLTSARHGHASVRDRLPRAQVVEWRDPAFLARFERFDAMAKPGYVLFHRRARRWLRENLQRGGYDLVHQVAPLAMRYPCPAVGLGVPWIMGPIGGSLTTPPAFAGDQRRAAWYTRLRAVDAWRFRHDPFLRRSYAGAAALIGVAPYVAELLDGIPLRRFEVESETGVLDAPEPAPRPRRDVVRLLHVGRLVPSKGCAHVIRALAETPEHTHLDVLGDGPDRDACRAAAEAAGVSHRVTLHGRVPRERVDDFYRDADVFVFPSVSEPSGNVVFEAMRHGLPVITCARGGPGHTVDDTCGVRLAVETPETLVSDLAAAITRLSDDAVSRERMGRAAWERMRDHALWPRKALRMLEIYRDVLEGGARDGVPDVSKRGALA